MDRNLWLEKVEELLVQVPRKGEAQRAFFSREARMLDAQLRIDDQCRDPLVLTAKARLAHARKRFREAGEIWRRVSELDSENTDHALLKSVKCSLEAGDLDLAYEHVQRISAQGKLDDTIAGTIADINRRKGLIDSNREYTRARAALMNGNSEGYITYAERAFELSGEPWACSSASLTLIREIAAFVLNEIPRQKVRVNLAQSHGGVPGNEAPAALFCAGFGWSGSGAVFDYLRQFQGCSVFTNQELALFHGDRWSVLDLLAISGGRWPVPADSSLVGKLLAAARWIAYSNRDFRAVIHDWMAAAIFGFSRPEQPLKAQMKSRRRALLSAMSGLEDQAATVSVLFLQDFCGRMRDGATTEPAFRYCIEEFFSRILKLRCSDAKYALFNNAIKGRELQLLKALPGDAKAIVVFRDPADAYVDRISWGKPIPVPMFIIKYRMNMRRYRAALRDVEIRNRIIPVQFEDFVRNEGTRRNLIEQLDMTEMSVIGKKATFVPEDSRKNVGIANQYNDQKVINRIRKALKGQTFS